jgi:predicted nucleic acid-binding protein
MRECGGPSSVRPLVDEMRVTLETDSDWNQAWSAYRQGHVGDAGIIDHISFVVMRRLGIMEVFGNDRHFNSAGFTTLF